MVDMARKDILPAVSGYSQKLCNTILAKNSVSTALSTTYEKDTIQEISCHLEKAYEITKALEKSLDEATTVTDVTAQGMYYKNNVLPKMAELRAHADALETLVDAKCWPFPTYADLLFGV